MSETHVDGDLGPGYIKIEVGEVNRGNRLGDFCNAVDEVVCYFQDQSGELNVNLAKCLRLLADRMEEN